MSSPYAPPQSEASVIAPRAAGKGIRLTVRSLSLGPLLASAGLLHFAGSLSAAAEELGFFKVYPHRALAILFLGYGGALPFVGSLVLAAAGLILSFRGRSRALPMLTFAIASLLLTVASFFGTIFLMREVVRFSGAT